MGFAVFKKGTHNAEKVYPNWLQQNEDSILEDANVKHPKLMHILSISKTLSKYPKCPFTLVLLMWESDTPTKKTYKIKAKLFAVVDTGS